MKIGLIGTGLMGSPMVEKLLEANFDMRVYNRTASRVTKLVEKGAKKIYKY